MSENEDILGLDDEEVSEAQPGGTRNYVKAGVHLFEIQSVKPKKTRKGDKAVIWELLTLESTVHRVGEIVTRYIDVHPEKGLGEFKSAVAATYGVDFDDVDGDALRKSYSESQPLAGKKIRCTANDGKTQEKKSDFTYCTWKNADAPEAKASA